MREIGFLLRQRTQLRSVVGKRLAASGKCLRVLLASSVAGMWLLTEPARAAEENALVGKIQPPLEQTIGHGHSALWTVPDVATQYQPVRPTPAIQTALQAQRAGRFLDALIALESAIKSPNASADETDEMNLLRVSFLLQGDQFEQAAKILAPLQGKPRHAADAHALAAMAHLQQGQMQEALQAAQRAKDSGDGMLTNLALSYALQAMGRLTEARGVIREFNSRAPQAVTLAREAELALMLDQVQSARALVAAAQESWGANPYVVAVDGLTRLMEGNPREARAAFEAVLQYDPKDTKALLGLGLAEIQLGNLQEGQKKLQAANEAAPGNAPILTYLGRAQQQTGQTEAAMASWRSAQQADPKDPNPWLYRAQAELQANRPLDARESLREAQARVAYRSVYRSERLLGEDEQLLQANLAEVQRRLGMENLAFHTLAGSLGEKSAASQRNQADVLQGQRFAESARRSLLLQSLFNERPGNLPAELDIYGDGAGQTGATTPQHGAVSMLGAQHASYNNYDELFGPRARVEAEAVAGSKGTKGEQVRLGVGNDTLGVSLAQRKYKTDGFSDFEGLDNGIWNANVQWRPAQSTQVFVWRQTFRSQRDEIVFPADPLFLGSQLMIEDTSKVTRLGLRHTLTDDSELRGLWSYQQTDQAIDYYDFSVPPNYFFSVHGSSGTHGGELQYRHSGENHATQWGLQQTRGQMAYPDSLIDMTVSARQIYAAWQQALNPLWQLEAGLGRGRIDNQDNTGGGNSASLQRWLPKLGVAYVPDIGTHVRLAAWKGMGLAGVGDASLAPVSLAGVLLTRPGDNGKLVQAINVGGNTQLSPAWLLAADAQRRKMDDPAISVVTGQQLLCEQRVAESKVALHWQPQGTPLVASLAFEGERIQNDPQFTAPDSLDDQTLRSQQLVMRWLASAQWTATLAWSHNRVDGTQKSRDPSTFNPLLLAYQDGFALLDAELNWQFSRLGSLTAGVRNAADTRFQYADIDRLNPRFSNGRLVYGKLKLAW